MLHVLADSESIWTIYSIGSPSFMYKVFNAIAMLGNGGVLMRMGQIGFLIGLFVLIYRIATAAGSLTDLRQSLLAGVIFAAMFGTTTSVKLIGMVPGPSGQNEVRIVDHVPWGIAAIGAVISGSGVYLTRRMETAFRDAESIPVTQGGFGRTAEILASVRAMSMPSIPNALPAYTYYRQSMLAYLQDCAMRARQFEVLSDHTLSHAPDPLSAIAYDNALQKTRSWLGTLSEQSEAISCPEAHALLTAKSGDMVASLDPSYQQRFGANALHTMQRAFATVAADSAESAQAYMTGAMINALWMDAASGSSFGAQGSNNTIMIRAALEQQRVQWAAEESIFLKTMRPMIGYFESFFYALSPFIAFLIGLGAMGLRMIVKYVSLTLAVSLWLPILAITNLYQITTLQDFFEVQRHAALAAGSGPFSLSNNLALVDQATGAVALASMIAAATPMLTLTLLFGGAVAATSLFSRLQGQDHINEKIVAPDPTSVGSVYQAAPAYVGNDAYGLRASGQEANALKFDLSEQLQQSARSLQARSHQASDQAARTWSQVMARSKTVQDQFSNALDHQLTDATSLSQNEGVQWLRANGFTDQQITSAMTEYADESRFQGRVGLDGSIDLAALLGGKGLVGMAGSMLGKGLKAVTKDLLPAVGGSAPSGGASGGNGIGSGLGSLMFSAGGSYVGSEARSEKSADGHSFNDQTSRSRQANSAFELAMQKATMAAMRDTVQHIATSGLSRQDNQQLAQTLTDLEQQTEAFEQAASNVSQLGMGQSINALAASRNLALDSERSAEVEQLARTLGGDAAFASNLAAIQRGNLPGMPVDADQQVAMASLMTLAGIGPGALLTENTPGLSSLRSDRLEALSYAVGASAGLAQPALRADAHEFAELRDVDASTVKRDANTMKSRVNAGTADEVDARFNTVVQAATSADTRHTVEREALEGGFVEQRASLQNEAIGSDNHRRGEVLGKLADQVDGFNNSAIHDALGPAFEVAQSTATPAGIVSVIGATADEVQAQIGPLGDAATHMSAEAQALWRSVTVDPSGETAPAAPTPTASAGDSVAPTTPTLLGSSLDERLQPYLDRAAKQGLTDEAQRGAALASYLHDHPLSLATPEAAADYARVSDELAKLPAFQTENALRSVIRMPVTGVSNLADQTRLRAASSPSPSGDPNEF